MTAKEQARYERLAVALRRILSYQTSRQVIKGAERQYGLEPIEALEYAYDNMRGEAEAVRGLVRAPRPKPVKTPAVDLMDALRRALPKNEAQP